MHAYSYWISFLILAARAQALASPRQLEIRGVGDTCIAENDCLSAKGYPLTCIHPGHSQYGYCQFKDCRYSGCGNHGMDDCIADGDDKPWKCVTGFYSAQEASSTTQVAASSQEPSSTPASSAAAQPSPIEAAPVFQAISSAAASSAAIDFPDPATITETGVYSIQTSPPTPESSAASQAPSDVARGSQPSSVDADSVVVASSASSASFSFSTPADAAASSDSVQSGVLPPTSLRSISSAFASSTSNSAVAPNRTTLAASGIPSGAAAKLTGSNGGIWIAIGAVMGVALL